MTEHPPQHTPIPVRPVDPRRVGPTSIDVVVGDPPVPITVWRTARTGTDHRRSIGARLAYRLVAAYTRPGQTVIDLTIDHALTAPCAAGRRRHHPGWLTDTPGPIIGPASPVPSAGPAHGGETVPAGDSELPELEGWFGDDLTDPDVPPADEPADPLPDDASVPAAASLVVACWPLDATDAANRVKLAWLLTGCARLLHPTGCLVLVAAPAGTVPAPEDFGPVAAAAAGAGLGYLQHIVAVAADTDGDAFVYHATDEELLTLAAGGQQPALAHLRVHTDLLVFSPVTPDQPSRTHRGGGRRG